jgi:hypothetical protein
MLIRAKCLPNSGGMMEKQDENKKENNSTTFSRQVKLKDFPKPVPL